MRLSLEGKERLAGGAFAGEVAKSARGDEVDFGTEEVGELVLEVAEPNERHAG